MDGTKNHPPPTPPYQLFKLNKDMEHIDDKSPATEEELRLMAIDDRIDAFIMGNMSPEEELQFMKDCKEDNELKERAYAIGLLVKVIKST